MNSHSTIKCLLAAAATWVCFSATPDIAACSENYYINNSRVLLYKIINWWYDSLPEDSQRLCGELIRCRSERNVQIEYDTDGMKIRFYTKESFADLLSVFKPCEPCWGPSFLQLTWLNKKYFGHGRYLPSTDRDSHLNSFIFGEIEGIHAEKIQSIVDAIGLELEGAICGLMNGKISLHHSGELLKTCPADGKRQDEDSPITLKIVNFQTEEVLAKFSAIFDGKNHRPTNAAEAKSSAD